MKQINIIGSLLFSITFVSCTQSVNNTNWSGMEGNDDLELILIDNGAGFLIKHYHYGVDTFNITFNQEGDRVILSRNDSIVSIDEPFVLNDDKLVGKNITFIKKDDEDI